MCESNNTNSGWLLDVILMAGVYASYPPLALLPHRQQSAQILSRSLQQRYMYMYSRKTHISSNVSS